MNAFVVGKKVMDSFFPGCMSSRLLPGKLGTAEIVIDSPSPWARLRGAVHGMPLEAERYARLFLDGRLMMTDAEFECKTNQHVSEFKGDVLVGGLGLGMVVEMMLRNRAVSSITVIEINRDVIGLVGPYFTDKRLKIKKGNVFNQKPPKASFDYVYMDIWNNVPNEGNSKELKRLRARYEPSLKPGGEFRAWCEGKFYP